MERSHLPGILAMALIVVVSNILVQHQFGNWLTYGAFTYPFAFLVTDVMNRIYGAKAARQTIFVGFLIGIFCSLVASNFGATTLRIALGSGVAFLTAQLLDVAVFDRMRGREWWKAPLASTVIGSSVDTALFFSIAFAGSLSFINPNDDVSWASDMIPMLGFGPAVPLWVSLAIADWMVKLTLALIALVPFRVLVQRIEGSETNKTF